MPCLFVVALVLPRRFVVTLFLFPHCFVVALFCCRVVLLPRCFCFRVVFVAALFLLPRRFCCRVVLLSRHFCCRVVLLPRRFCCRVIVSLRFNSSPLFYLRAFWAAYRLILPRLVERGLYQICLDSSSLSARSTCREQIDGFLSLI